MRKEHKYSQEDLANKLGISRQAVSRWECAESSPDTDNLINLSRLYNISLDKLLATTDEISEQREWQRTFISDPSSVAAPQKKVYPGKPIPIKARAFLHLLIIVFSLAAYIAMGFVWNLWHPGWIVFLAIPLLITAVEGVSAVKKTKSVSSFLFRFCYPVTIVAVYLVCFAYGLWRPLWMVFLTIPIYYGVAAMLLKSKASEKEKDDALLSCKD